MGGEAKRKAKRIREWREGLSNERFVTPLHATGMCYRLAFFLTEFLQNEHAIEVEPIIGYVNDGTTDLAASHAWIEKLGKITDISLAYTDDPEVQLSGEVLLVGFIFRPGNRYTYRREQTSANQTALYRLQSHPRQGWIVAHKEREHASMLEINASSESRRRFLDSAPDGYNYSRMAEIVKSPVVR